jgi:hypothetical protein
VSSTVSVPHYAGPASDIDPRVTQQLDINLAGVAPETFLNSTWAGTQRGFGQSAVENIFTPDWTQDGFLTAQSFGKFDDF